LKSVRTRLTYANVMSSIAVFLVLGGATAFAAGQLAKNSVGTKQLKNNAVTTKKIKNNAVTTAKIKNNAVTGAKINESTLGEVPSAASAANSNAANGMHFGRINFVAGANTPPTVIFSANGLTLTADCDGGQELNVSATTSVSNSEIYESGNYDDTYAGGWDDNFDVGDAEEVGEEIGDHTQQEVQGQLVYSNPTGGIVTAQFSLNDNEEAFGGTQVCSVEGTVQFS
jgi:hypothetical protein